MFDGLALSSLFDNEGAPPDIDLPHERLELLTGSSSFSLHFAPELPCEFPSSVTLTVLLECPSPSANAFVVAPFGPWTEPKPDTFFPAGKATLYGAAAFRFPCESRPSSPAARTRRTRRTSRCSAAGR